MSAVQVFTYKDGLLARLAHDLRIRVTSYRISLEEGRVTASFDPASARVDGVAHGDRVDAAELSDRDKRSIEATIVDEVLGRAPVLYEGVVDGTTVLGRLTLRGRTEPLDVQVATTKGGLVVDVPLVPSRWGIAPYRALAGAIRLQDRWRVRLVLPWKGGDFARATIDWRE